MSAIPSRYAPERALPEVAYLPGRTPRPPEEAHETEALTPENAERSRGYLFGVDLFNHEFYWEAHEAWETIWLHLDRDDPVRTHLQGLIQAAAALLKLRLGEPAPARTIWARGRARLESVQSGVSAPTFLGVAYPALIAALDDATELGSIPSTPPRIELRW